MTGAAARADLDARRTVPIARWSPRSRWRPRPRDRVRRGTPSHASQRNDRQRPGGSMVIQLVRVSVKPDQRERWLELVRANAAETRTEDGCETYEVCEDVEAPNTFVLVERWRDLDSQYDHFRNPK